MDNPGAVRAEGGQDRRRCPRRKILKFIQVVFPDKLAVLDCTLKSLSANGALICGQSLVDVPNRFYVRTPAQHRLVPCEAVRRTLTSIAVRFEGDPGHLVDGL